MKSPSELSPFVVTSLNIHANSRLREPQRLAYEAVRNHFACSREPALVQIPVGCGKTGLISLLPFGLSQRRALIVAPNVTIREALFRAVDSAHPECFWRSTGVTPGDRNGPFAARIDGDNTNDADLRQSHFVVTNVQQLALSTSRWLPRFPADFFDLLIFDEGHHNPAKSWQRLMQHFPKAKIISLTATPFRGDGQTVVGQPVFRYSFLRSMKLGFIKRLKSVQVAPCELSFTFKDTPRQCSLEEVLQLSEEVWFSRGIALSETCNKSLVATSIQECTKLRVRSQVRQQIIAVACSVDHARQIADLYRRAGLRAAEIHSQQSASDQQRTLQELRAGLLDVIVQVQMLGEGFDHPPLSVAAIFRPFRSLSPYVQFVGRVMRVIPNRPGGDQGVVVSHVGLNVHRHWTQFQELDTSDQQLWTGIIGGQSQTGTRAAVHDTAQTEPQVFQPEMLVEWERFEFSIAPSDGCVIEPVLLDRLTPDDSRPQAAAPAWRGPQEQRQLAKSQLSQRVDDAIRQTLVAARIPPSGWHIGRQVPSLRRFNNWTATRVWIYRELNATLHRKAAPTKTWSLEETEAALHSLTSVQQRIAAQVAIWGARN